MSDDTTAVREGFALDEGALLAWLRGNVPEMAGARSIAVRQFRGGQSNPTYAVTIDDRHYVLRKKPPGALLAGAHAVEREYRVIAALAKADFPVARAVALCEDTAVIGTAFYLMAKVEGRVFWDPALPEVPREGRAAIYDAMNATIARLHSVDYTAVGLADFGKPGNYFARQLKRWGGQYRDDTAAGQVADMDRLLDWLQANIPPGDETSLVHGDFRCDNMFFHASEPRVVAVLDWELATLGHPLADFGYHLMTYRMPSHAIPGLAGADLAQLGIPDEASYVAAYCRRTGRDGLPHLDYYLAFNFFRLAAIFHGIRGRLIRGTAASARAQEYAAQVEGIAALGWVQALKSTQSAG